MEHIVLIIHLILAFALVVLVLIQRSEGAGLVGPSASNMAPIRGSANILTRATGIIAGCFFVTSLTLAILASHTRAPQSIAEQLATQQQEQGTPPVSDAAVPVPAPASDAAPAPAAPATTPETAPATPAPASPVTPPTAQ